MSTTHRSIQNPTTTRYTSDDASARPTPAGPRAGRPSPTPGTPLSQTSKGASSVVYPNGQTQFQEQLPPRGAHKSTSEQAEQDIFAQHASYVSDLEAAAAAMGQTGVVPPPSIAEIRRARQHAAGGCGTCGAFLAGLARGASGGVQIAKAAAAAEAQARAQQATQAPLTSHPAGVERVQQAVRDVQAAVAQQQRATDTAAELTRIAIALQPGRSGSERTGKR